MKGMAEKRKERRTKGSHSSAGGARGCDLGRGVLSVCHDWRRVLRVCLCDGHEDDGFQDARFAVGTYFVESRLRRSSAPATSQLRER